MAKARPDLAKPLSVLLGDVFSDAYAKQGFAARELVTRWAEIAGPEIAAHSEPLKIQWPRPVEGQPQEPATLVLRVEGPMALEIQHSSDVHAAAGQPLLRLERGGTAGAAAGAAVAPGPAAARPARRTPNRWPKVARNAVRGRGRRIARRAGPARRLDQAKLRLPRPGRVAARHCHNCRFKLANSFLFRSFGRERANPGANR